MTARPDILCIGSVLWDIIGRTPAHMVSGADVPGRITRLPGGVAMNIAMTLARFGLRPAILTAIGRDAEGDELVASCRRLGLLTDHVYRSDDLPTDRYMAVEGGNGLVAAIIGVIWLFTSGHLHREADHRFRVTLDQTRGVPIVEAAPEEFSDAVAATTPIRVQDQR